MKARCINNVIVNLYCSPELLDNADGMMLLLSEVDGGLPRCFIAYSSIFYNVKEVAASFKLHSTCILYGHTRARRNRRSPAAPVESRITTTTIIIINGD